MYTPNYDNGAIELIVGKDKSLVRVQSAMGVFKVADKYDIEQFTWPISDDIKAGHEKISNSEGRTRL